MILAIVEGKRQDKQQNQRKTNSSHYENSICFFKENFMKVWIASDKNLSKPFDLHFTRKDMGPVFIENN